MCSKASDATLPARYPVAAVVALFLEFPELSARSAPKIRRHHAPTSRAQLSWGLGHVSSERAGRRIRVAGGRRRSVEAEGRESPLFIGEEPSLTVETPRTMASDPLVEGVDGVATVHLKAEDVVRHELVSRIVTAYDGADGQAKGDD